jgi:hypothetical protein
MFSGDAGAYSDGDCLLISSLWGHAYGYEALSCPAMLLSYPCLDFLFSVLRRFVKGQPIMRLGNDYLRNRINFQYRKVLTSKSMANFAPVLYVAGASAGVTFLGYLTDWLRIASNQ